jgi:hypothetical protein
MRDTDQDKFCQVLGAVFEVYGSAITPGAMSIWWESMRRYDLSQFRAALSLHVNNPQAGRFAPKPADVIREIEALRGDGRPGPEEAWAMIPKREDQSAMLTDEMREAMRFADPLLESGDKIAARMAFREAYERAVAAAKARREPVRWSFSAGWDAEGRVSALSEAVKIGRMDRDRAIRMLPAGREVEFLTRIGATDHPLLAPPTPEQAERRAMILRIAGQMAGVVHD